MVSQTVGRVTEQGSGPALIGPLPDPLIAGHTFLQQRISLGIRPLGKRHSSQRQQAGSDPVGQPDLPGQRQPCLGVFVGLFVASLVHLDRRQHGPGVADIVILVQLLVAGQALLQPLAGLGMAAAPQGPPYALDNT